MKALAVVQDEMVGWQKHNFPGRPNWIPLLGAVEEMGELAESDKRTDILDAVGDIVIYLCDYSNSMSYNLSELWDEQKSVRTYGITLDQVKAVQIHMGRLAHSHIKAFQNIRRNEDHAGNAKLAIGRILHHLDVICTIEETTLETVIFTTWEQVKARDWQKNRDTAHVQG